MSSSAPLSLVQRHELILRTEFGELPFRFAQLLAVAVGLAVEELKGSSRPAEFDVLLEVEALQLLQHMLRQFGRGVEVGDGDDVGLLDRLRIDPARDPASRERHLLAAGLRDGFAQLFAAERDEVFHEGLIRQQLDLGIHAGFGRISAGADVFPGVRLGADDGRLARILDEHLHLRRVELFLSQGHKQGEQEGEHKQRHEQPPVAEDRPNDGHRILLIRAHARFELLFRNPWLLCRSTSISLLLFGPIQTDFRAIGRWSRRGGEERSRGARLLEKATSNRLRCHSSPSPMFPQATTPYPRFRQGTFTSKTRSAIATTSPFHAHRPAWKPVTARAPEMSAPWE